MASGFQRITLAQMQEVLKAEKGWQMDEQGNEYVFWFRLRSRPLIVVKVYSSIKLNTKAGRDVGRDAIRVLAVIQEEPYMRWDAGKGFITAPIVKRVTNWRVTLEQRVREVIQQAIARFDKKPRQFNLPEKGTK